MSAWKSFLIPVVTSAAFATAWAVFSQDRKEEKPAADRPASQSEEKKLSEHALELARTESRTYSFSLGQAPDAELKFVSEPILRWSNPQQGTIYGGVFVWTLEGRPEIVASIFKWFAPHTHLSAEFHSLATGSVTASRDGGAVWWASQPGIAFQPVPDAPPPAATAAARLRQLRDLAKEFKSIKTDRDGNRGDLRLLPQPIYRYDSPKRDIQDGALFAFVEGTDPETFLLLESRKTGAGFEWQFACARMNSTAFEVQHREKKVWSIEVLPWRDVTSHKEPYTTFMRRDVE